MSTADIIYSLGTYGAETDILHTWKVEEDGQVIADLYVSVETGEIVNIEVVKAHRGEGLARALYEAACAQMAVFHAPASHRTAEGNAFAVAVGGEALTCTYGCCEEEEI